MNIHIIRIHFGALDILLLQMGNELHTGLLWNSVQLPDVLCVGDADIF